MVELLPRFLTDMNTKIMLYGAEEMRRVSDIYHRWFSLFSSNTPSLEEHPQANVFRKFKDGNPLTDLASPVIQCGGSNDKYSAAARLSAPVTAGIRQEIHWDGWPDSHLVRHLLNANFSWGTV